LSTLKVSSALSALKAASLTLPTWTCSHGLLLDLPLSQVFNHPKRENSGCYRITAVIIHIPQLDIGSLGITIIFCVH
jgi:hypothetical protein